MVQIPRLGRGGLRQQDGGVNFSIQNKKIATNVAIFLFLQRLESKDHTLF